MLITPEGFLPRDAGLFAVLLVYARRQAAGHAGEQPHRR
jgi:hypothetical protein